MSSFSRGSYGRRYGGSSSGHRGYRRGYGRRGGLLRRVIGRRGGIGCAVFVGAFVSLGASITGLVWWIA